MILAFSASSDGVSHPALDNGRVEKLDPVVAIDGEHGALRRFPTGQ